jgi:hypothetical protein
MQRRTWLKLGVTSAALLAVVGGVAALIQPGLDKGALTTTGKDIFRAVGRSVLDKTLPEQPGLQSAALDQLLERIDVLMAALPPHAQAEVSQLLSILGSAAGRRGLAGLHTPWQEATVPQLQAALQDMRLSSLAVRQQAYAALHDITAGAYFSEPATWAVLGYPGPLAF